MRPRYKDYMGGSINGCTQLSSIYGWIFHNKNHAFKETSIYRRDGSPRILLLMIDVAKAAGIALFAAAGDEVNASAERCPKRVIVMVLFFLDICYCVMLQVTVMLCYVMLFFKSIHNNISHFMVLIERIYISTGVTMPLSLIFD